MFAADSRQNVYRCSSDFCTLRELLARRSAKWPVRPCQTQMAPCPALSQFFSPILFGLRASGFQFHGHTTPMSEQNKPRPEELAGHLHMENRTILCGFLVALVLAVMIGVDLEIHN